MRTTACDLCGKTRAALVVDMSFISGLGFPELPDGTYGEHHFCNLDHLADWAQERSVDSIRLPGRTA